MHRLSSIRSSTSPSLQILSLVRRTQRILEERLAVRCARRSWNWPTLVSRRHSMKTRYVPFFRSASFLCPEHFTQGRSCEHTETYHFRHDWTCAWDRSGRKSEKKKTAHIYFLPAGFEIENLFFFTISEKDELRSRRRLTSLAHRFFWTDGPWMTTLQTHI